jgi:hypothetical protein
VETKSKSVGRVAQRTGLINLVDQPTRDTPGGPLLLSFLAYAKVNPIFIEHLVSLPVFRPKCVVARTGQVNFYRL